jgi:hypothetical protein
MQNPTSFPAIIPFFLRTSQSLASQYFSEQDQPAAHHENPWLSTSIYSFSSFLRFGRVHNFTLFLLFLKSLAVKLGDMPVCGYCCMTYFPTEAASAT